MTTLANYAKLMLCVTAVVDMCWSYGQNLAVK